MDQVVAELLAARSFAAVLERLSDLDGLEARCGASLADLLADLAHVLRRAPEPLPQDAEWAHPSGARIDRRALALLEATLDAHRDALTADPGRLFPVTYNALYWHDAPERDAFADEVLPRDAQGIWRWMDHWRRAFESRPGSRWLRRVRPPRPSSTAVLAWRVPGGAPELSPDGGHLLVTHAASTELLDARTGRSIAKLPRTGEYLGAGQKAHGGFAPQSDRLLTFEGTRATVWSYGASRPPAVLRELGPCARAVRRAAFSRDGGVAFTVAGDEVHAFRVEDGALLGTLDAPKGVRDLLPWRDAMVLVLDAGWTLWDPLTGRILAAHAVRSDSARGPAWSAALSAMGDRLVVRRRDVLEAWALPEARRIFERSLSSQQQLAVHPDGIVFAVRSNAQTAVLHDMETGEARTHLPGSHVQGIAFDPTGRFLLASTRQISRLWDLASGRVAAWAFQGIAAEGAVSFSGDGKRLAIGDERSTVVLDLETLAPAPALRDDAPPPSPYQPVHFTPSGATLIVEQTEGLSFWDVRSGARRRVVPTEHGAVHCGDHVLCFRDGVLVALVPEDGAERFTLAVAGDRLEYPRDPAEGDVLVARTNGGQLVGFSLSDGRELYRLEGPAKLQRIAPDLFVARTSDGRLDVRSVATGDAILSLPVTGGRSFSLSPDRRWLAVTGFDDEERGDGNVVEVWELAPGGRRHVLSTTFSPDPLWWSPDGTRVASRSTGPFPQSGNSDPDESSDEATLEPGEPYLAHRGHPPAAPAPRIEPTRLRDFAPDLVWDGGAGTLADGVVQRTAGAVFVARATAEQVEIYELS